LTKGPNPEVGKDEENTVTNGCSSCGRGSAQEKNKKCAKWQPSINIYIVIFRTIYNTTLYFEIAIPIRYTTSTSHYGA
jgi:hypothetical protein